MTRLTRAFAVIFAVAAAVLAFSGDASAQRVLGGFKEIAATDATAKKAAEFAIAAEVKKTEKEIELIEVIKAERQTVAGSNYRMCLKVSDSGAEGQDAAEVFVKVVVNIDLKGKYKVVSYEASDCGEGEG